MLQNYKQLDFAGRVFVETEQVPGFCHDLQSNLGIQSDVKPIGVSTKCS